MSDPTLPSSQSPGADDRLAPAHPAPGGTKPHPHPEHQDREGAKIGMWLFLFTEMILFGGLFLLYSAYRARFPREFASAGAMLDHTLGIVNTLILLTSSLTVACSITAMAKGSRRLSMGLVAVTVVLAGCFLGVKAVEWSTKIHHGLYPSGPFLATRPPGEVLFFGLYYVTTGLHGLHVIAGAIALLVTLGLAALGRVCPDDHVVLENAGLYWHLVDAVWIFILPLYYLAV